MQFVVAKIKKRKDFVSAAQKGHKAVEQGVVVQVCPHEHQQGTHILVRLGFTASKKVGNAVRRNRTKRRLRAVAQRVIPGAVKRSQDIVIIGRIHTCERTFNDLVYDLRRALERIETIYSRKHGN